MPATGLRIFGQALLALAFAAGLPAQEPADPVHRAAEALGKGDFAGFTAAFDASTPALARIRADAAELMRQTDAQSTIRPAGESGSGDSRILQLDWELRIADKDTTGGTTFRRTAVTCHVAPRGGQWRITEFEPRDFFRPPNVRKAWNVLESAAAALNNANAPGFLSYFEKSMPGYSRLSAGAAALVARGEIQSSIEMIGNEGTDTVRTLEVAWTMRIISEDTQIQRTARAKKVKCRVELRGRRWRITALDPVDFFGPILLGMEFPHQREPRVVLLDRTPERSGPPGGDAGDPRGHCAEA